MPPWRVQGKLQAMSTHDWSPQLRRNQAIRELLRMIRAVIRDGEVSDLEAEFLRFWLSANPDLLGLPPLDRIVPALRRLSDGDQALDPGARTALLHLLQEVVGAYDETASAEPPAD